MLVFVAGSMITLGLGLTISQLIEPFKNTKMVFLATITNFVIVPLFALGLVLLLPVSEGVRIGIILLSLGGGAAFIPKIVETAKGNVAGAIGLMVLLLIISIFYMPVVTPLILTETSVSPWDIAKPLIFTMLVPLAIALFVNARFSDIAARLKPYAGKLTDLSLLLLVITVLILYTKDIIANASVLPVVLVFFLGAMAIGFVAGGKRKDVRLLMLVGAGLRNPAVAMLVASQNFSTEPMAAMVPLLGIIIGLLILFPMAIMIGKKT